jgi:hypothetical protein
MDNPTTLLVAIMYVTIVATGLVNVLMALSDIVGGKLKTDSVHTGWLVLLLLAYLSFFWETTAILDIEGWDFILFVSFIIGPIILLFATNLVTSPGDIDKGASMDPYYFEQSGRFFLMLCLVQVWTIGLDIVFSNVGNATYLTVGIGVLLLALMISKNYRFHVTGLAVMAIAFVLRIVLQAIYPG